jgi:hypothetical protein
MSIIVTGTTSQSVAVTNSKAVSFSTPNYCGPRMVTWSPNYTFLAVDSTYSTLTLSTNNVGDANIYTVTVTVSLQNYPAITPVTLTLGVTITCSVLSLAWINPPSNILVEPGVTL